MAATHTTNLGLNKPARQDLVKVVTDINDNMDMIDQAMGAVPQGQNLQAQVMALNQAITTLNDHIANVVSRPIASSSVSIASMLNNSLDGAIKSFSFSSSATRPSDLPSSCSEYGWGFIVNSGYYQLVLVQDVASGDIYIGNKVSGSGYSIGFHHFVPT